MSEEDRTKQNSFMSMFKIYKSQSQEGDELLRQWTSLMLKDARLSLFLLSELQALAEKSPQHKDDIDSLNKLKDALTNLRKPLEQMDELLLKAKRATSTDSKDEEFETALKALEEIKHAVEQISGLIPTESTQNFDVKTPENNYNMSKNILSYALTRITKFESKLEAETNKAYKAYSEPSKTSTTHPKPY